VMQRLNNADIYQTLRDRIVYLTYSPGERLALGALCKEFGVSSTPLREVLIRLESEGLVRLVPGIGAFASEISLQNLRDVFEVRLHLLSQVGRLAAQRASDEEIATMRGLIKNFEIEKDRQVLLMLDSQFHDLINTATKNACLPKILANLRCQLMRLWHFIAEDTAYPATFAGDFAGLVSALEKRNGQKAAALLVKHSMRFMKEVQRSLQEAAGSGQLFVELKEGR